MSAQMETLRDGQEFEHSEIHFYCFTIFTWKVYNCINAFIKLKISKCVSLALAFHFLGNEIEQKQAILHFQGLFCGYYTETTVETIVTG